QAYSQIGRRANRQIGKWAGRRMENCRKTVGTGEACPRNRADFVRPTKIVGTGASLSDKSGGLRPPLQKL
ncbi:MAG: hypothetical protein RMK89_14245, partial [Armatimonadota bacterium]|nr:hypothetical protein [Armatimonadota bacterium]MDW8144605.1 hypothetical protein [Armatimonadota bacterium]